MNRRASDNDEVLYTMLGRRLNEVGCCDIRKLCQQHVILVGGCGDDIKMGSRSCGWAEWEVAASTSRLITFEINEEGVGAYKVSS